MNLRRSWTRLNLRSMLAAPDEESCLDEEGEAGMDGSKGKRRKRKEADRPRRAQA